MKAENSGYYPLPHGAADGMPIAERAALVLMADDGTNLEGWERASLTEWATFAPGNYYKPNIVTDRIGIRLYGRETWAATVGKLWER
jgi:hypothetical protein